MLLVDSDWAQPSLDIRVGQGGPAGERGDGRIDTILLRLPELAQGREALDTWLGRDRDDLCLLLAPASRRSLDNIGDEHLDYLFGQLLAPAFDVVVVDLGSAAGLADRPQSWTTFWLARADTVLVPLRDRPDHLRSATAAAHALSALGIGRMRLVLQAVQGQLAPADHGAAGLGGWVVHRVPWLQLGQPPEGRSLFDLSEPMADAIVALLPDLLAPRE
ncbi:MAG: hypothetical protein ACREN4_03550 [Candidatus Dormibacteria bacterium]